jgi:hypothetical protein
MERKEMLAVKKWIEKRHGYVPQDKLTDEFLLEEIKLYRIHELSKALSRESLKKSQ